MKKLQWPGLTVFGRNGLVSKGGRNIEQFGFPNADSLKSDLCRAMQR